MVAKDKHYIRKEHGPKPWDMGSPGDSQISSRKIITIKMRQKLDNFHTQLVKEELGSADSEKLYYKLDGL